MTPRPERLLCVLFVRPPHAEVTRLHIEERGGRESTPWGRWSETHRSGVMRELFSARYRFVACAKNRFQAKPIGSARKRGKPSPSESDTAGAMRLSSFGETARARRSARTGGAKRTRRSSPSPPPCSSSSSARTRTSRAPRASAPLPHRHSSTRPCPAPRSHRGSQAGVGEPLTHSLRIQYHTEAVVLLPPAQIGSSAPGPPSPTASGPCRRGASRAPSVSTCAFSTPGPCKPLGQTPVLDALERRRPHSSQV